MNSTETFQKLDKNYMNSTENPTVIPQKLHSTKTPQKSHMNFIESPQKLQRNYTETSRKLHTNSTGTSQELHRSFTGTRNSIESREMGTHVMSMNWDIWANGIYGISNRLYNIWNIWEHIMLASRELLVVCTIECNRKGLFVSFDIEFLTHIANWFPLIISACLSVT